MILRAALCAIFILATGLVQAEVYDAPPQGDDIIGQTLHIKAAEPDTFVALAQRYNVGFNELKLANPGVDAWVPGAGTEITIPQAHILPDTPHDGIVVNLAGMRVYYFPPKNSPHAGKVFTYPLSIGRQGWSTPLGTTTIVRKKAHPTWTPPQSIRKEHAANGDPLPPVVPAGPDNPLGQYAMYLGFPSYLMHGTNKPAGVGMRVSHGCLRMFPEDIKSLFSMVKVGTKVTIVNEPYKFGWRDGKLYMEAHPPDATGKDKVRSYTPWVKALVKATRKRPDTPIDWDKAQQVARDADGIPVMIEASGKRATGEQIANK